MRVSSGGSRGKKQLQQLPIKKRTKRKDMVSVQLQGYTCLYAYDRASTTPTLIP